MATYTWTAPATESTGVVIDATAWTQQVQQNMQCLGLTQTYVPTIAGTGWAKGNGTITASYFAAGNWVKVWIHFVLGTTSTGGSAGLTFTLPTAPVLDGAGVSIVNKGGTPYAGVCVASSGAGTLGVYSLTALFALTGVVNGVPSAGNWATGDIINAQVEYTV